MTSSESGVVPSSTSPCMTGAPAGSLSRRTERAEGSSGSGGGAETSVVVVGAVRRSRASATSSGALEITMVTAKAVASTMRAAPIASGTLGRPARRPPRPWASRSTSGRQAMSRASIASALSKRSSGSLPSAFITSLSRVRGMGRSGAATRGEGGVSRMCLAITTTASSSTNGGEPVSS